MIFLEFRIGCGFFQQFVQHCNLWRYLVLGMNTPIRTTIRAAIRAAIKQLLS